jgi:diguanylate cyclase (GGDEF)-like protein
LPSWEKAFLQKQCINGIVRKLSPTEFDLLNQQGILSLMVVPIYLKEQFWGFVGFDDCHTERLFTENEVTILYSASELIANAVVRNNMERDLQLLETEVDKIYYDSLTGIYNRRYLDENITRTFQFLSRSLSYCSVMMVDIDYFKGYNDTYGHSQGDNCLKIVAKSLHDSITRSEDYVARYGGEEFAVILPNADADGAKVVAEKMLANIRNCNIPHETNKDNNFLTVSIGVVSGKVRYPFDAYKYLQRADEMLYLAKRSGRNRYAFTVI